MSAGMSGAAIGGFMTILHWILSIPALAVLFFAGVVGYGGYTFIEYAMFDGQVAACDQPIAVARASLTPPQCRGEASTHHTAERF
jgi:hypothetical protein